MPRYLFILVLAALILSGIAYPVWQWVTNNGWVYYLNGYDEYTYLQYDYSLSAQGATRPGQYLVSLAHRAGMSGGMINLVLDLVTLLAFPLLVFGVWCRLGWEPSRARSAAIVIVGLPLLVSGINPLVDRLNLWNLQSGMIYWLTVPHLHTPAFVRSPEPQFSLTLLALVVLAALRWRSFWPVYVALPVMYPFVAIPAAFVALACDLKRRWPTSWTWPVAGPLLAAFFAVSCAITVYFNLLVPASVREVMVPTHLPLVSFTGTVTLAFLALTWRAIPQAMRFPALAIALAPWVAANHQWLSGHVAQPNNAEQYFGTLGMAVVIAMAALHLGRWRTVTVALAVLLFTRSSYVTFRTNQINNGRLPLTPALLESLRRAPGSTAINDVHMASVMNLVLPQQGPTALSYAQTFVGLAERHAPLYRCTKQRILTEQPQDVGFKAALLFLDSAYAYGGQNIPLLSLLRKSTFKQLYDVVPTGCEAPSPPLRYFHLQHGTGQVSD